MGKRKTRLCAKSFKRRITFSVPTLFNRVIQSKEKAEQKEDEKEEKRKKDK